MSSATRAFRPALAAATAALAAPATLAAAPNVAQPQPGPFTVATDRLDIRIGDQVRPGAWSLSETANPDILTVPLARGESKRVCLASGPAAYCRTLREGESHDFTIVYQGRRYPQRFLGRYVPPMAVFDAAYREENRGKVRFSVPEAYELVNVAIALTPSAQENQGLVYRDSDYHRKVVEHFGAYRDHPLVRAIERELRSGAGYSRVKMNGNAFVFSPEGRIERSRVYDRTGFNGDTDNVLAPMLPQMQDFADKSGFRAFYAAHRPLYQEQIDFFQQSIGSDDMLQWLRAHFPSVRPYDTTSVVFSPLVYANQSATWMESDGFSELQPHINFPYPGAAHAGYSPRSVLLRRGQLLFTELNHGFINPTADRYAAQIDAAIQHREWWTAANSTGSGYGGDLPMFNEMMNWALVSLFIWDKAPAAERDRLIAAVNPFMERRGFARFPQFNYFLVDLYAKRPKGTPLEALYPQIIAWFAARDADRNEAPAVARHSTDWGKILREEAQRIHDTLAANHPGPVDAQNPGFRRLLEDGLRLAQERAGSASSEEHVIWALRRYTASFEDGHLNYWSHRQAAPQRWPGFITTYRGTDQVVAARAAETAPPLGATLVSCDGMAADRLAQLRLGAAYGRWQLESQRRAFGHRMFVDYGDPYAPTPRRCSFAVNGRASDHELNWRPTTQEALAAHLESLPKPARAATELRFLSDGTPWIGVESFATQHGNSEKLEAVLAAVEEAQPRIRSASAIVVDLRGNDGGSSSWSVKLAELIYGKPYVDANSPPGGFAEWRVSADNIRTAEGYRRQFANQPQTWIEPLVAGLKEAMSAGRTLYRPAATAGATPPQAPSAYRGRVFVLTDGACFSACLDAVDLFKGLGAVQVGHETSADTLYMENTGIRLDSGIGGLGYPMKVYRGRPRGLNETHRPAHVFTGDMADTAALEGWIAGLRARRR